MPAALQRSSSFCLIGREASETSHSLAPRALNPLPVPWPLTEMLTLGKLLLNFSLARLEMGSTVLEPSIVIFPERLALSLFATSGVVAVFEGSVAFGVPQPAATANNDVKKTKFKIVRVIRLSDMRVGVLEAFQSLSSVLWGRG